jgi:hypothetical protein
MELQELAVLRGQMELVALQGLVELLEQVVQAEQAVLQEQVVHQVLTEHREPVELQVLQGYLLQEIH